MDKNKSNSLYHPPLIIRISISQISPFSEEFKNHISEYSLKFEGTNNNKFNIYNLSYILKNPIDLIPLKSPLLNSITIYLMRSGNSISKGILYLIKNKNEQTIKFSKINMNIRFNYILNAADFLKNNKIDKNIKNKKFKKNNSPDKNISLNNKKLSESKENKNNCKLMSKKIKNNIYYRNSNNIIINNKKKNSNYENSCIDLRTNYKENSKKENKNNELNPKIFSYFSTTFENKDRLNRVSDSNEWINNTKILLKKVDRYLSKRNEPNNSKKKFKKSLSARNIKSLTIYKDKLNKFLTERKPLINKLSNSSKELSLEKINKFKNIINKNSLLISDEDNYNKTISANSSKKYLLYKRYFSLKKNFTSLNKFNIKENNSYFDKTNQFSKTSNKKILNKKQIEIKNQIQNKLLFNDSNNNEKNSLLLTNKIRGRENNIKNSLKRNIYNKPLFNIKFFSPQIKKIDKNNLIFNNRYNNDDSSKDINNNLNIDSNSNSLIFKNKISFTNNNNLDELNSIKINTFNNKEKKSNLNNEENDNENKKEEFILSNNNIFNKEEIHSFDFKDILDDNNKNNLFPNFYRLKEDFSLLYNKNYIKNIKAELLKLEIELFLEKIIEFIYEYHSRLNEEKNIYRDLLNLNKRNKNQYIIIYKLVKKLQIIKEQKNINMKTIQIDFIKTEKNDLFNSKNEIILFHNLFKNNKKVYENNFNKEKTNSKLIIKELKNILIKILNQNNNKEKILDNAKNKNWIKSKIIKNNALDNILFNSNFINNNKVKKKHIKIKFKIDKK